MGLLSENHPLTAVTTSIQSLSGPSYPVDDVAGIVDLVDIVQSQYTGATEAARALRKQLKYGNEHNQLRALTLLGALVENGGSKLRPLYNDVKLLDRLRTIAVDSTAAPSKVQRRTRALISGWAVDFASNRDYAGLAGLSAQLPKPRALSGSPGPGTRSRSNSNPRGSGSRSNTLHEEDFERQVRDNVRDKDNVRGKDADNNPESQHKQLQARREERRRRQAQKNASRTSERAEPALTGPALQSKVSQTLANASTAAIKLQNELQLIGASQPSDVDSCVRAFESCKQHRRTVLKLIHMVESDEYLGSLIHANEELVKALTKYDSVNKGIEDHLDRLELHGHESEYDSDDSDSDDERSHPVPRQLQRVESAISTASNPFDDKNEY